MGHFFTILSSEMEDQLRKVARAQQELMMAPDGNLKSRQRKTKVDFYQAINGKNLNISADSNMIQKLLKKYVNRKLLRSAKVNIRILKRAMELYEPNEYSDIMEKMPITYKRANIGIYQSKSATQNTFLYSPETHIHNTKSGVKVRSKSEVIIADTLTKYGIPFEYEPLFEGRTEDGKRMNPDFRIKCADGYVFIWEHWGLLIEISYCMQQGKKLNVYQKHGYVVGENLILTADDDKGGCNAQTIDEIVRTKILPHMGY